MTLAEIYEAATALAPASITANKLGYTYASWTLIDPSNDALDISISLGSAELIINSKDGSVTGWLLRPDELMWFGMVGGLLQENS